VGKTLPTFHVAAGASLAYFGSVDSRLQGHRVHPIHIRFDDPAVDYNRWPEFWAR
jgi:hypothetical protein